MKKLIAAFPLLGTLASPSAFAADTYVGLELSDDFESSSGYTLSFDHNFKGDGSIALSWSESSSDATATLPASDTESYEIGYYSSSEQTLMVSLFYNGWSSSDHQEGYTVGGSLSADAGDWRLSIHPEYNHLTLTDPTGRTVATTSNPGIGAGLDYYGFENWALSASHYEYDYSVETRRFRSQNPLSLTTLNRLRLIGSQIAASLDDSRSGVGATYYWPRHSLGLDYERSTGALDNVDYWQYNLRWDWLVDQHWTLSLSANRSDGDNLEARDYYSAGISYGW